jgi:hypothetical protein
MKGTQEEKGEKGRADLSWKDVLTPLYLTFSTNLYSSLNCTTIRFV